MHSYFNTYCHVVLFLITYCKWCISISRFCPMTSNHVSIAAGPFKTADNLQQLSCPFFFFFSLPRSYTLSAFFCSFWLFSDQDKGYARNHLDLRPLQETTFHRERARERDRVWPTPIRYKQCLFSIWNVDACSQLETRISDIRCSKHTHFTTGALVNSRPL